MNKITFFLLVMMTSFNRTKSFVPVVPPSNRRNNNKKKKPAAEAKETTPEVSLSFSSDPQSLSSFSSINIKICQNKDCCKNFPSKYDGGLIQILQDLVITTTGTMVTVESSGCLSQCNYGPNISVNDDRVFGKIDGVLAAAAVLEVVANVDCSGQLMAAIEDMATANKLNDPIQKTKHLTSVINSLHQQGDATATSTAMAHALILRADAYLDCIPPNTEEALKDALQAISLNEHVSNGRAWRILADAKEIMGDIRGAMEAVSTWSEKNVLSSGKAKKELERLSKKLNI
mmetsp:Transcript_29/g.62  ORF Transcript_29/g.62 Transcript_29/m.62 type:complete len:288 (-) Transcript_29:734-1597(-)